MEKRNPKISVIVPVYNVEQYLRRCIDSILAQTFTDFELLLIDDGSKDSSGEICEEYAGKDARIRVFHRQNGGVSTARNLGIDKAKGEWITFSDSVDELLPDAFEAVCGYMHEGIDMIKTGYQILNEHNQIMETHLCDKTAQVRKSVDSPPGILTEDHHHTVHEERQVCYSSHLRPKSLHL